MPSAPVAAFAEPNVTANITTNKEKKVLFVDAKRTASGVRVKLQACSELGQIIKQFSIRAGHNRPTTMHGIPIWAGATNYDQVLRISIPNAPVLDSWVLLHAKLAEQEEVEFTLEMPHSREALKLAVERIRVAGNALYLEYAKTLTVRGSVMVPDEE